MYFCFTSNLKSCGDIQNGHSYNNAIPASSFVMVQAYTMSVINDIWRKKNVFKHGSTLVQETKEK